MTPEYQQLCIYYHRRLHEAVKKYKQRHAIYNQGVDRRRKAIAVLRLLLKKRKMKYNTKRFWISELCESRPEYEAYYSVYPCLLEDSCTFRNYCRLTSVQFEELFVLLEPEITKLQRTRDPISARERLLLTLRYLASGDSQASMAYEFGLGTTAVCNIMFEVCVAIWKILSPRVLSVPTVETWTRIASEFRDRWNFPHCIGAIDGKQIVIIAPAHSGSMYYNYKDTHSLISLAICDAQYRFTIMDIGAEGRQSDGGVFRRSTVGQIFVKNQADLPPPSELDDTDRVLPYVLVGDAAFPLSEFSMRPYPDRTGILFEQQNFNYRLGRARRMIESTFGILVSQWRIFSRPINTNEKTAHKIVEACVCLHNWTRESSIADSTFDPDINNIECVDHRFEGPGVINITQAGSNTYLRNATNIRDSFAEYFGNEGSVEWQWNHRV